jgi:hypothetical protein
MCVFSSFKAEKSLVPDLLMSVVFVAILSVHIIIQKDDPTIQILTNERVFNSDGNIWHF